MRRFLPVITLIVLAPLVAEMLPGSTRITMPGLLLFNLLLYGPGALLIRELVGRRARGWASILLLGAAYGLIEEGLALQSLFNPDYNHVAQWGARIFGINGVYTKVVIVIHMVWSAAIPILLTELLFPAQRKIPYLRRFGLIVTGLWYILGVALIGLSSRFSYPYQVPPVLTGLVVVIALALAVVALFVLPRSTRRPETPINAPRPWVVLLLTGIGAFVWLAMLSLLWRVQPAFVQWPLVLVPMVGALVLGAGMLWLVRHWAQASGWGDRHVLALASGALIAHSVVGGMIFSHTMTDRISIIILGLVMLLLLALFAAWIRHRGGSDRTPPPEGGTDQDVSGSLVGVSFGQPPQAPSGSMASGNMSYVRKETPNQRFITRVLLACGAVGPLLFIGALFIEGATRPGYNAWEQPGSSLSLGQEGWMQITNFIVCGVLVLSFTLGLKRVLPAGPGSIGGPILLGLFGLALVAAGLFVTDPTKGYALGAASNAQTLIGAIHNASGVVAFSILPTALFVFVRRFLGNPLWKRWAAYSIAAGVLIIGFFVAYLVAAILVQYGTLNNAPIGLFQRVSIVIGWSWLAFFALRLLRKGGQSLAKA